MGENTLLPILAESFCLANINRRERMFGYLVGSGGLPCVPHGVTFQGAHGPLSFADCLKESNARLTRWSLALEQYDFIVEHRACVKNVNADGLTRMF